MVRRLNRYELYRDEQHQWRWRFVSANGNIMADSAEGYVRRIDAMRGIMVLMSSEEAEIVNTEQEKGSQDEPSTS